MVVFAGGCERDCGGAAKDVREDQSAVLTVFSLDHTKFLGRKFQLFFISLLWFKCIFEALPTNFCNF